MKKLFKKINTSNGYTLLFAVLVSSLVLGIGISILSVSKKEFALSSSARESSVSFYSADSGMECAINREFHGSVLVSPFNPLSTNPEVYCGMSTYDLVINENPSNNQLQNLGDEITYTFDIKTGSLNSPACARVEVRKYVEEYNGSNITRTVIDSYGYNVGWVEGVGGASGTCTGSNPKKVERLLTVTY